jgi:hypothetical protein
MRRAQLVKAAADATRSLRSFLGKKKFQINEVSLIAPIVYATVPVKALPTIGKRADVRRIYYAEDVSEDHLDIAAKAMRTDQVWNDLGYSGTGSLPREPASKSLSPGTLTRPAPEIISTTILSTRTSTFRLSGERLT